jgi:hypothetical protein
MQDEQKQDTVESPALPGDVRFEREDVQVVGDPAAASTDAEGEDLASAGTAAAEAETVPAEAAGAPAATTAPPFADPVGSAGQSPADAQRRAEAGPQGTPIRPIVVAFVGAFVLAKLLGRFGGGDD